MSNADEMRRIVVKAGTNVVTDASGALDEKVIESLVAQIAELWRVGKDVLLVTSGAIAAGMKKMGLASRPRDMALQQACAAAGQSVLIRTYEEIFSRHGIKVAQVLLTSEDFSEKERYLNLKNVFDGLLKARVLPIINENDVVSTRELERARGGAVAFGDNDELAALVSSKMNADMLVLLTDVDGLYSSDPKKGRSEMLRTVEKITPEIEGLAGKANERGRGGMRSKIRAARIANYAGALVVIANGKQKGVLERALNGEAGTLFLPEQHMSGKRRWLAFSSAPKGVISVDERAMDALRGGASLLAVGVKGVEGRFEKGEVVDIACVGKTIARGITSYTAGDIAAMAGKRSSEIGDGRRAKEIINHKSIVML